jgi:YidC/Oxa1 family membrane protein insertase
MPVDQLRTLLFVALFAVAFLIWQAWRVDYGPERAPPAAPAAQDAVDRIGVPPAPDVPDALAGDVPRTLPADGLAPAVVGDGQRVVVTTDLLRAEIDTRGGNLHRVDLLDYPVSVDRPDEPFGLMNDTLPNVFMAQSGLVGSSEAPTHHALFVPEATSYTLGHGQDRVEVRLHWAGDGPIAVDKVYVFHRDSYVVDVGFEVANPSPDPWTGRMYGQFQRTQVAAEGGFFRTYTYTGGVISGPDKPYEKITFSDMADLDLDRTIEGGWAAMIQHYFAGAWIPDQEALNHYYTKALDDARYVIGLLTPEQRVEPGTLRELSLQLYVGPKIQDRLQPLAPHLERTVDYGWLWFIAAPLFWVLSWIHGFVGNWGWSIIILTCLIKAAFFHLSATSYKSMARMRKMQPRIMAIRDRYQNDKQRMNQAMMDLYRKEKINPLGGCLPIVVQIPVFIALYWVLLESVELRQASFIWWIRDLSEYDPYFVLPLLMGATMFIQTKLNPAPPDPMQAKIMLALPVVFTFLFLFFPSGLVLYWFINNLLSIAQQWYITKKIIGPDPPSTGAIAGATTAAGTSSNPDPGPGGTDPDVDTDAEPEPGEGKDPGATAGTGNRAGTGDGERPATGKAPGQGKGKGKGRGRGKSKGAGRGPGAAAGTRKNPDAGG